MRNTKTKRGVPAGLAGLLLLLAACTAPAAGVPAPTASPTPASAHPVTVATSSGYIAQRYPDDAEWRTKMQYTDADYSLLGSLQADGYQDISVAEFNALVFACEDEDAFHRAENAVQRLRCTLPEADPLFPFLSTTLERTWSECQIKHYNACMHGRLPLVDGSAQYERYGDVFGDKVLVAGGYANYWYHYEITDETTLTVGERDALIARIADGMQSYLSGQTEETLKQNESVEKSLKAELERLIKQYSTQAICASDGDVDYHWERMY